MSAGDTVVVLEAMKMEQPLTAHKGGTVTGLAVEIGQTVTAARSSARSRASRASGLWASGLPGFGLPGWLGFRASRALGLPAQAPGAHGGAALEPGG